METLYMARNGCLTPVKADCDGYVYDSSREMVWSCGDGGKEYERGHPFRALPLAAKPVELRGLIKSFVLCEYAGMPEHHRIVSRSADENDHPIPRKYELAWEWLRENHPGLVGSEAENAQWLAAHNIRLAEGESARQWMFAGRETVVRIFEATR